MIDHHRLNGMFLAAVALYLATSAAQLHARQPNWHGADAASLAAVGSAVKHGLVEAVKLQGEQGGMFAPGN